GTITHPFGTGPKRGGIEKAVVPPNTDLGGACRRSTGRSDVGLANLGGGEWHNLGRVDRRGLQRFSANDGLLAGGSPLRPPRSTRGGWSRSEGPQRAGSQSLPVPDLGGSVG